MFWILSRRLAGIYLNYGLFHTETNWARTVQIGQQILGDLHSAWKKGALVPVLWIFTETGIYELYPEAKKKKASIFMYKTSIRYSCLRMSVCQDREINFLLIITEEKPTIEDIGDQSSKKVLALSPTYFPCLESEQWNERSLILFHVEKQLQI